MAYQAHTFEPTDDSLEMRAEAFARALRDHRNAKTSLDLFRKNQAHERLGTREEIEYAYEVSKNTLEKGLESFLPDELENLRKLLSKEDAQEFEKLKRQKLIQSSRTKNSSKGKDYSKNR